MNVEQQKCHPLGVSVAHHDLCYNPTIPIGIENQTQRVDKIIEIDMMIAPKTRRVDKIVAMQKNVKPKTRRVDKIIEKSMNVEQQKYHPSGISVQHHNIFYNHTIRQKRFESQIRHLAD